MLTLKQVRTVQFFMNNLRDYCQFNNIHFPFNKLIFEYNNDFVTADWLDDDFKVSHESKVSLRTTYLSEFSNATTDFPREKLNILINDRIKLTNLIFKVAQEFDQLEEINWVSNIEFLKSKLSFENYYFNSTSDFNLVSF